MVLFLFPVSTCDNIEASQEAPLLFVFWEEYLHAVSFLLFMLRHCILFVHLFV